MLLRHLFTAKVHPEVSGTILAKAFIAQKHLQQIHSSQDNITGDKLNKRWICEKSKDLVSLDAEDSCNPESSAENARDRVGVRIFHLNLLDRSILRRAIVNTKRRQRC